MYPSAGIIDKKWVANEDGQFVPSYFADRDDLVDAMQFARDMYTDGVGSKRILRWQSWKPARKSTFRGRVLPWYSHGPVPRD